MAEYSINTQGSDQSCFALPKKCINTNQMLLCVFVLGRLWLLTLVSCGSCGPALSDRSDTIRSMQPALSDGAALSDPCDRRYQMERRYQMLQSTLSDRGSFRPAREFPSGAIRSCNFSIDPIRFRDLSIGSERCYQICDLSTGAIGSCDPSTGTIGSCNRRHQIFRPAREFSSGAIRFYDPTTSAIRSLDRCYQILQSALSDHQFSSGAIRFCDLSSGTIRSCDLSLDAITSCNFSIHVQVTGAQ